MSSAILPAGVRDLVALMALGQVRSVAPHPLTAVSVVKNVGGPDSIWIDLGYPLVDYGLLWRVVYPTALIPAGQHVAPLLSREEALRNSFKFVRLGLVGLNGRPSTAESGYVLTAVSHSATDNS